MATFGQMIPRSLFEVPRLGFYNFHHSDDTWPSYPGPVPIRDMVRDGKTHVVITMHEVTAVLDGGDAFARSHKVPLPPDANSVKVHRLTWPQMGPFIRRVVGSILEVGVEESKDESQFLHDAEVPYRVVSQWKYTERIAA